MGAGRRIFLVVCFVLIPLIVAPYAFFVICGKTARRDPSFRPHLWLIALWLAIVIASSGKRSHHHIITSQHNYSAVEISQSFFKAFPTHSLTYLLKRRRKKTDFFLSHY